MPNTSEFSRKTRVRALIEPNDEPDSYETDETEGCGDGATTFGGSSNTGLAFPRVR